MTFPSCEHTQRICRFFKKRKPVHGQKVVPGANSPWPNEKPQPLSNNNNNNNTLSDDSEMTFSTTSNSKSPSVLVVAPPPYKEKSDSLKSLKSFEIVPPSPHDHR